MSGQAHFKAIHKVVDGLEIDNKVYIPNGSRASTGLPWCPITDYVLKSTFLKDLCKIVEISWPGSMMVDCSEPSMVTPVSTTLTWTINVIAFGTSSEGHLALSPGFGVPCPVAAIYDMYGVGNLADPFWTIKIPHRASKLPKDLSEDSLNAEYEEGPIPIRGSVSLEGQASGPPDFSDPRRAFAFTQIGNRTVMDVIFPSKDWDKVDPARNISSQFPPTLIVHGMNDTMVPFDLNRDLYAKLQNQGVNCGRRRIPGEKHTFFASMRIGS